MAEVSEQKLKGIVASMMERQAQEARKAPSGIVGGLWEKATGEIQKYNEASEKLIRLSVQRKKRIQQIADAQERLSEIQTEVDQGLRKGTEAMLDAKQEMRELTKTIEKLQEENEDAAESFNTSKQALQEMNKSGGILRNGLTVLAAKAGGAATAFFSWNQALDSVDARMKLASKSISATAGATGNYNVSIGDAIDQTLEWNEAVNETNSRMARLGIGTEDTRKIMASMSEGLRLTTSDQGELIDQTTQLTQDVGVMSKLLRVNTDELAAASVEASKRFGTSASDMSDDMAGLFTSIQKIKEGSKDSVVSFSDLTRATLEAQSTFQGYNFNLKTTANILGNVVAKAQEQGATYEMSMKAAKGLAGVFTGGKAPDWAKFVAGKKLRNEVRQVVADAREAGGDIEEALRESFGEDLSDAQVKGLENLADNWRKYGQLSSAKMAEELLRGTERGTEEMFELMKKQADKPEGRELLMRVWGLDEAAATAATLALSTAENVEDFTRIKDEALKAAEKRKPPTVEDLRNQTEAYTDAMATMENGIVGQLKILVGQFKDSPFVSGAIGAAGAVSSIGLQALQTSMLSRVAGAVTDTRAGRAAGGAVGGAANMFGRIRDLFGRGGVTSSRSGGVVMDVSRRSRAMKALSKTTGGVVDVFKKMRGSVNRLGAPLTKMTSGLTRIGGPLAGLAGKMGLLGLAAAVGGAVGSLLRLIPGVDSFAESVINAGAKLLGFKGSLTEAEAAQEALNNQSKGVQKALAQVTAGITTDYEKNSFKRMVAIRQLQDLREEDLEAYATKIAESGKLDKEQAMQRLRSLQAEKVDSAKFLEARNEAMRKGLIAPPANAAKTTPVPTPMQKRIGAPTALPTPRAAEQADSRSRGGRGRGVQQSVESVQPNGDITIKLNVSRDALAKSEMIAAGMSQ